jgi:hypothetical protein
MCERRRGTKTYPSDFSVLLVAGVTVFRQGTASPPPWGQLSLYLQRYESVLGRLITRLPHLMANGGVSC